MKSKKSFFSLLLSYLLLSLGLTTIFTPRHVFVWKLSILASEYGHWFALVIIALFIFQRSSMMKTLFGQIQALVLLAGLILFLRPLILAQSNSRLWINNLKQNLDVSIESPLISYSQLVLGRKIKKIIPENYSYTQELDLDFYRSNASTPTPWVVVIHGGGWDSGSKTEFSSFNSHLAQQGVSVVAVSYRLAPKYKWPSQKEDVQSAVSYVKGKAKELNIDPNRWAVLGRSAGGQIAQSIAYQSIDPTLKGVIAFYSPSDLEFAYRNTKDHDIINSRELLVNLLAGNPDQVPNNYHEASPLYFVNRESPPTLLIHGRPDCLTWVRHSQRLIEKINQVGAKGVYIELPWATHAFDFNMNGPGGQIATKAVDGFLAKVFYEENLNKGDHS